jgi:hypothetical protein
MEVKHIMRISVTVGDELGGRLVQNAEREGRSLANYVRRQLARTAAESLPPGCDPGDAVRAEQVPPAGERQQPAAA